MQNKKKDLCLTLPELEKVHGSSYCEYSVIENGQAQLYRNQVKIYNALKLLLGIKVDIHKITTEIEALEQEEEYNDID